MNQSNYALLTALYDSQSSDFYKEIYFPIIKYGIFLLFQNQKEMTKYYDTTNIQDQIIINFGIKVPLIVIKQALKIIAKTHFDISIKLLGGGDQFEIKRIWDVALINSIERRSQQNVENFNKLQKAFDVYLKENNVESESNFIDFFSDNTEDIYHYLNNDTTSEFAVNAEYVQITNFLAWIKENNVALYDIASDIFWGSIIAAFLQRDADLNIKSEVKISYYLDSSLVLSLLDLDSTANNLYCIELVSMIKKAGHIACVHPLTIKEVDSILFSVERDKLPKPHSGISEAYDRRKLTPTKILIIRQSLRKSIEDHGIYIDPLTEAQIEDIQYRYKTKATVRSLAGTRSTTSSTETIRDIHDVYMYDLVCEKNSRCVSIDKANSYFVTLNAELINYFRNSKKGPYIKPIIHPARIVLDLWIHSSRPSDIKKNALTEVIARCTALNQTDVRHKLRLISQHYKEYDFSEEVYSAVYLALVNRSQQVISSVEMLQDPHISEEKKEEYFSDIINAALKEEKLRQKRDIDRQTVIDNLRQALAERDKQKENLNQENHKHKHLFSLSEQLIDAEAGLRKSEERIKVLEPARNSLCMWRYWFVLSLQAVCIVVLFSCVVVYIVSCVRQSESFTDLIVQNIEILVSACVAVLSFLIAGEVQKLWIIYPRKAYRKHKLAILKRWASENPDYVKEKTNIKRLRHKINRLSSEIDEYKRCLQ